MDNLMETGVHKLHLSNGTVVTFMATEDVVHILKPLFSHIIEDEKLADVIRTFTKAWDVVGIYIAKRLAGVFKPNAWGTLTRLPDVMCELQMYRSRIIMYGPEEIDGETQTQWYVRLNRPVSEIDGALVDGRPSDALVDLVCQPLWDMALEGTTPLSDVTPDGAMHTSFSFHVTGRRVIVSNRHYRDV